MMMMMMMMKRGSQTFSILDHANGVDVSRTVGAS